MNGLETEIRTKDVSLGVYLVHKTAKQVLSRLWLDENDCEMSKDEKINALAKRAKLLFFIVGYANLWRSFALVVVVA